MNKKNLVNDAPNKVTPHITYTDLNKYKSLIYKDNLKKSGIYRWNNLITNKSYVGSSINLGNRLSVYYSKKSMRAKIKTRISIIYSALLKYGYSNFTLDILEYCEVNILMEREEYYFILKLEYNILKAANSRIGSKHSLKTRALISLKLKGINNPSFGKILSSETRMKISESLKYSFTFKNSIKLRPKHITYETKLKRSRCKEVSVKVYDKNANLVKEFPTMISVALDFNISSRTVGRYLDKDISYNGYTFISNFKDD